MLDTIIHTDYFGDESFKAIKRTGIDNEIYRDEEKIKNTRRRQKRTDHTTNEIT